MIEGLQQGHPASQGLPPGHQCHHPAADLLAHRRGQLEPPPPADDLLQDELKEQIKLLIWFPQSWTDEFLQWDPDEWGGIEKVNVPISEIWMPDGYIFNT